MAGVLQCGFGMVACVAEIGWRSGEVGHRGWKR